MRRKSSWNTSWKKFKASFGGNISLFERGGGEKKRKFLDGKREEKVRTRS